MISLESIAKMSLEDLQLYVNAFHNSPDGIGISKLADGTFLRVNKGFLQIFGYSEAEVIGKTSIEIKLYSQKDREKLIAALKSQGKLYEYELELNTKGGNIISTQVYANIIAASNENYLVFIVRDVTNKLKDEKDLRLLKEIVDISSQAFGLGSLDGEIPYQNKALISLLGANNLDEVKAHGFINFYDEKHQDILTNEIFPILFEKGSWQGELPLTNLKGKKLLTYNQLTLLRDENGNPELLLNLVDDITEKREQEIKIKEQEEQFRIISNSSMNSIIMIDNNSLVTFWNPASERLFGYAKDEILGKNIHQILPSKEYGDATVKGFNRFKSTGEGPAVGKILELNAVHKNGNTFPIEISVSAINREGKWHAVANVRDITEKKKAADELEKHRNRQEELVSIRTRELEEQQFRLAKYFKVISTLVVDDIFIQGKVKQAYDLAVKSAAETLGVSRVGIWLYGINQASIICATLYEQGKEFNYPKVELFKRDFPTYFKALENNRIIDIADAQNDKITAEFNESYLKPLGITSMLDVPIKVGGKTIGVICHEHTGEKRIWAIEEINFVVSLSDLLTKAIEAEKRIQAENDLVKAKKELEKEKALTDALMENIPDYIYFKDLDSRFLRVSASLLKLFGVNNYNEIIGKTDFDAQEEEFARKFFDEEQEIIKTKKPILNDIVKVRQPNGEEIWEATTKMPLFDSKRNVIGTFGITKDITEVKKQEELVKEVNYRIEMAAEYTNVGIWDWNAQTDTTIGNPVWKRLFGVKSNDKVFSTWVENIHPDDIDSVMQNFSAHMSGETEKYEAVFRYNHPDNGWVWLKSTGKVVEFDESGKPLRMLGTTLDISEIKLIEQELLEAKEKAEESENQLKLIADNFVNGMIYQVAMLDENKRQFNYISEAVTKLYGCTVQEAKENSNLIYSRLHPEDIGPLIEIEKEALRNMSVFKTEARVFNPDGTIRWSYYVSKPRIIDNIVCWDGLELDITDRKQIELELRRNEEKLHESMLKLEQSNKELEQFAYVASHDLKEPLRKIKNYTELLSLKYKSKLDEKAEKYIDTITSGANRMDNLISDLLRLSRVSTQGKEFTKIDMNEIINEVKEIFELKIKKEDAQIIVDKLPVINGDGGQLMQVFQNLIGNALKFKGESRPIVEIKVEDEGKDWLIKVKDNGVGFKADYVDKIFVMFQRLHSREQYEGTGIGLAICKKIIDRHGGKIWAESTPGNGATFFLTLPKK